MWVKYQSVKKKLKNVRLEFSNNKNKKTKNKRNRRNKNLKDLKKRIAIDNKKFFIIVNIILIEKF